MTRWFDRRWYLYLWRRMPAEARVLVVAALLLLALGGGWFVSVLASASAHPSTDAYLIKSTTVTKVVTVRKNGKAIVRRFPVVHTVQVKAKLVTVKELRTVETPSGTRTVPVVKRTFVPVTHIENHTVTNVVREAGKTRTVVTTTPVKVPVTVSSTTTNERTVTNNRTTTNFTTNVVTVTRTNNVTTTRTENDTTTRTNNVTTTLPPQTTTLPPQTTTQTVVRTTTQLVTTTQPPATQTTTKTVVTTETTTVTLPSVTVTVTTKKEG